jgi:rhomboid protease GluP
MFELERLRDRKAPPATVGLGAVTILVFLVELVLGGGGMDPGVNLAMGASYQPLVWKQHQFWRLVCPIFLHYGVMHIVLNGYGLSQLGPFVERVWGSWRFLVVYLMSGIMGAALSSRFSDAMSVGASGAVFGLLGFLIGAIHSGRQKHEVRAVFSTLMGQSILFWAGVNLLLGFVPNLMGLGVRVDNLAHVGGLATGFALSFVLVETEEPEPWLRALTIVLVLAIPTSFGFAFAAHRGNVRKSQLTRSIMELYQEGDYERVALMCEQFLKDNPQDPQVPTWLNIEGMALLKAGRVDDARTAFERSYRVSPMVPTAAFLIDVAVATSDARAGLRWAEEFAGKVENRALLSEVLIHSARLRPLTTDPALLADIASLESRVQARLGK